jgi:hypothetical protein
MDVGDYADVFFSCGIDRPRMQKCRLALLALSFAILSFCAAF